jgi:hypothetical protein
LSRLLRQPAFARQPHSSPISRSGQRRAGIPARFSPSLPAGSLRACPGVELRPVASLAFPTEPKLKDVDPDQISYCIGRETVIASEERPGMAVWREEVFVLMQRNAEETASYFCVPAKRALEVGTDIEI